MSESGMGVHVLLADRYQLEEMLGSGAMGEVWRATDQVLGRPVAVKLLKAEDTTDIERFRTEAQTTARLNHPHVVSVYDFGSDHGRLHLVMELLDGWTLAQERSLRGTVEPQEASAIAAQVAAGLSAAHRQGVIHRDIKPANIMLTTGRTVKITDFGIARFTDDTAATATATGKILGTADYLAPERALGRTAQPASDVYSLGCVLYELLTGRPPFRGATSLDVVRQHVAATPPPPDLLNPAIPRPLSDYVLRLLAKEPEQRPSTEETAARLGTEAAIGRRDRQRAADRQGTQEEAAWPGAQEVAGPSGTSAADRQSTWETADGQGARDRTPPVAGRNITACAPTPATAPPPPRQSRAPATHSRPGKRRRQVSKAVLGGVAVALFAGATALGAALDSAGESPASPVSPTRTPTAVTDGPASTAANATPSAAIPPAGPAPAKGRGDDERHGGKGRHGKDEKGGGG
ncbi:serine/threonine-protein kinase [Streptomyces sp. NPDC001401]|uniref:serine/threonine-protein kinase n=1 Tax=Streptomyces sp. NPDC001401 TaxID=3364570 RepID=UPI0036BC17D9